MAEMYYLIDDKNNKYEINKSDFTLGRKIGSDLVINDSKVSRLHASIHITNGKLWIRDENSTIGLFVNGKIVQQMVLHNGDLIQIGDSKFFIKVTEIDSGLSSKTPFVQTPGQYKAMVGFGLVGLLVVSMVFLLIFKKPQKDTFGEMNNLNQNEITSEPQGISASEIKIDCKGMSYNQDIHTCYLNYDGDILTNIAILFSPIKEIQTNHYQVRVMRQDEQLDSALDETGKLDLGNLKPGQKTSFDIHTICEFKDIGCPKTEIHLQIISYQDNFSDYVLIQQYDMVLEYKSTVITLPIKPPSSNIILPTFTQVPNQSSPSKPKPTSTPSDGLAPNP